jgi:hypothetical protein
VNYEYFFIRDADRKSRKVLRVLASNPLRASAIVSKHCGNNTDIHAIEIENLFDEKLILDGNNPAATKRRTSR